MDFSEVGGLWVSIFTHRPPQVWAALIGGMLFAFRKSGASTRAGRYIETGVSGLIGYSWGPDAATYADVSLEVATLLITAVGYAGLDMIRAVLLDGSAIKSWVFRVLGGPNGNNGK